MTTRDTPWPDGTPCWVDLMTTDVVAARTFYGDLFGWQFEVGSEESGFYATAELDGKKVAGIGQLQMDHPPVWSTYFAAADLEAGADGIARAGGTIVAPPMDVMGLGRMAVAQDPTRGTFGLWQALDFIGAERVNEPGALVWNELMTRDYAGSKDFYSAVFSFSYTELGDDNFRYSTIEVDGNTVGGLGELPGDVPAAVPPHWRVYFEVADTDDVVARAVSIGAEVLRPAADMPYGRHADLADPQGAMFSVIKSATPG